MNIFTCLIISIGIILTLCLIGDFIEWLCDKLDVDFLAFLFLLLIICILANMLYIGTN